MFAVIFFTNSNVLFGQETRVELGNKYFDQFAYAEAIPFYEEAIKKSRMDSRILANLGDCYYYTLELDKALVMYKKVIDIQKENVNQEYLLRYAQCLQSTGGTEQEVIGAFENYYKKIGKASVKIGLRHAVDQLDVENLSSINSDSSDFGTFIFKNQLYFSSSRKNPDKDKKYNKRLYNWNRNPFLDLYSAVIDRTNDSLKIVAPDSAFDLINTRAHEGSVTISSNGNTMYYSGGDVENDVIQYNKRGTSILKLKKAVWDAKIQKWVEDSRDSLVNKLDFNSYSVGNPALSPNNNILFFATCAPYNEARGQSDIYYVEIKNGIYGEPKSVPGINTPGRESFPFVSKDSTLYFSSDGVYNDSLGLGFLDIYKVKNIYNVIKTGKAEVVHVNAPINSVMDDFAYFEEPIEGNECEVIGYFSSNWEGRPNAKGSDDIYRVKLNKTKTIKGRIIDYFTNTPLTGATVQLLDSADHIRTISVDSTGSYSIDVECNQIYRLSGNKDMYNEDLKNFNSSEVTGNIDLALKINPCKIPYNKIIVFDPRGADTISQQAKDSIAPLVALLKTYSDIKLRIESFTDSKDDEAFNLDLSQRRADATKTYLIEEVGIDESRILGAKGFGEKCLLLSDEFINSLPTQQEKNEAHLKNRRSQILIVGCDNASVKCKEDDP